MPLNNNGDEVLLIDGGGVVRSRAAYAGLEARAGSWVKFDPPAFDINVNRAGNRVEFERFRPQIEFERKRAR